MPNLGRDLMFFNAEIQKLENAIAALSKVGFSQRKLLAEIVLIRLFLLLENSIELISCKIACGAGYLDGTIPNLTMRHRSIDSSLAFMETHNRPPRYRARWNGSQEIRDNLTFILPPTDSFFSCIQRYASHITEWRYIRNHIAHRNRSTRQKFNNVVRKHYGAIKRGLTPGTLLLSPRLGSPVLVVQYLVQAKILIKELVRA